MAYKETGYFWFGLELFIDDDGDLAEKSTTDRNYLEANDFFAAVTEVEGTKDLPNYIRLYHHNDDGSDTSKVVGDYAIMRPDEPSSRIWDYSAEYERKIFEVRIEEQR